jgi:hypothetical protein
MTGSINNKLFGFRHSVQRTTDLIGYCCVHQIAHCRNEGGIIGQRRHESNVACKPGRDAIRNQAGSCHQEARTGHLCQPPISKTANAAGQRDKIVDNASLRAAFMDDDFGFPFRWGKIEVQGDESLAGTWLQVLGYVLVAGII